MTREPVALALFAGGFVTLGLVAGLLIYYLAQPWVLSRQGLQGIRSTLQEVERHLLTRIYRASRPRRFIGQQGGRHLGRAGR